MPSVHSKIKALLLASRPKTLVAAILPVICGSALGSHDSKFFNKTVFVLALLSTIFIQIATNYFNDAIDFKKGSDNSNRLGPKRMTQSGIMNYSEMMKWGVIMLLLSLGFGLPLVFSHGWGILLIGIISLFFSYSYTGGPFPLAYLGLGELFVFIFFGLIAVGGSYFLQTQQISTHSMLLGSQLGFFSTILISINNLRDINEDSQNKKITFAVRLGQNKMKLFILNLHIFPYLLLHFWKTEIPLCAYLPLLILPLSIFISSKVLFNEPSRYFNKLLALSALQYLLFSLFFVIGLLWSNH